MCWGNYEGPHTDDVPLDEIVEHIYRAEVSALLLSMANPRHEHDYHSLERHRLPGGMKLIVGAIDSTTNYVEHPEVVADRIERAARVVGDPRRIMAGTDCGFDTSAGIRHGSGRDRVGKTARAIGRRGNRQPPPLRISFRWRPNLPATEQWIRGKTCMITGATSGIGRASALELGRMGAKLMLVCRNRERGEELVREIQRAGNPEVELMVADLESQAQIRKLAADFLATKKPLHVLMNNAGVFNMKRVLTSDGLEEVFAVNHLAYFMLTLLLLDRIKESAPARIINISSDLHQRATIKFDDLGGERSYGGNEFLRAIETREYPFHLRTRAPARGHRRDGELRASGRGRDQPREQQWRDRRVRVEAHRGLYEITG